MVVNVKVNAIAHRAANSESRHAHLPTAADVLDELPVLSFHRRLFAKVAIGLFFDVFDLYIASAVASILVATKWATLAGVAPLTSFTLAGMMLGSLSAGFLGDRVGRRPAFRWSLAVAGVGSLAAALAPNLTVLIAGRFTTGLGLGAEAVLAYAAFAEFLPRAVRGRWVGLMGMVGNTAVVFAAIAGYLVAPWGGWRWLFMIGVLGALVGWFVRRDIPESPRWLEARGRRAEALMVINFIAKPTYSQTTTTAVVHEMVDTQTSQKRGKAALTRSLLVGSVMTATLYTSIYSFLTWLPSLMVAEGKALPKSLLLNILMSCGAVVGTAASGLIADRSGRRISITLLAGTSAALGILYGFVRTPELQALVGFLLYTSIYALAGVSVFIYVPELFPTEFRLRGAGASVTIGRACAVAAPFALPSIFASFGILGVSVAIATILLIETIVVLLFGPETRARPLR